ncbi:hypothetical protein D5086_025723 [Populus alba]|uniref:Uncharacterized protein n=2 Tax=Populus TaxID=3689 RepID=A0ACC4B0E5_POPAL|nr:hypothetical protein NC653_032558 [Populus alba x Populus x berolinensis]
MAGCSGSLKKERIDNNRELSNEKEPWKQKKRRENILISTVACWKRREVPKEFHQAESGWGLPLFVALISELTRKTTCVLIYLCTNGSGLHIGPIFF